jgi:hypothetical protein
LWVGCTTTPLTASAGTSAPPGTDSVVSPLRNAATRSPASSTTLTRCPSERPSPRELGRVGPLELEDD